MTPFLPARLDDHVAQRHAFLDVEGVDAVAVEFHGAIGGAVAADVADDGEDQVLGHEVRRQVAVEDEAHGRRRFQPELARTQDEAGIGVADAGGEFAEGPGGAGVAVGAEQHFAGTRVPFLGQGDVADALVAVGADVVEVRQVLFLHEVAEHVHVAVGHRVFGEDVVVGNDDDLLAVPDLGLSPKCFLKMPMVPGPQTSCVMSTSTSTQTFSPGTTLDLPAARARIFSVIVMGEGISVFPVWIQRERGLGLERRQSSSNVMAACGVSTLELYRPDRLPHSGGSLDIEDNCA